MKTVLVNPPWFCLQNRRNLILPVGLASIAAVLEANGHEIAILNGEQIAAPLSIDDSVSVPDAFFHDTHRYTALQRPDHPLWTKLAEAIAAEKPSVVGVTMWSGAYRAAANVCRLVKASLPDAVTVVGGVHATLDPHSVLEIPEVDYVVSGEGEMACAALWNTLRSHPGDRARASRIKGVWFREGGEIHEGGRSEYTRDLDSLPIPNYGRVRGEIEPNIGGIITSRGCPYGCDFCASKEIWTRRVRYRSVDSVIAELAAYREKHEASHFRINDDSFCLRKDRVTEFRDKLLERFGRGAWIFSADANADTLDEDVLRTLESAGCVSLAIGIESVAPRIREEFIRKKIDLDKVREIVSSLNRSTIESGAYFMTGFPGETADELEATIEFMDQIRPVSSMWSIVTAYPGTKLHRYATEHGILPSADPESLTHHSTRTSMARIPADQHEAMLRRILAMWEEHARDRRDLLRTRPRQRAAIGRRDLRHRARRTLRLLKSPRTAVRRLGKKLR